MYTYKKGDDGDVAVVVSRAELENLTYILRQYARNEISRGMVEQVSFWLSVLQGPVPDELWYDEEDDDVA